MLLAHFAASGSAALDLPAWALAYTAFAVSVIVILIARSRHVPRPRPRPTPAEGGVGGTTVDVGGPGRAVRIGQVVTAVVFWVFVAMCWFGPPQLTQNIAPLVIIGVLWSLGGWVAMAAGWCWEALDPFAVFTRGADRAGHDRVPVRWWSPLPVFVTFVVVWVAWIEGDEPRHLAVWLTAYGVAMIAVARLGGTTALRAWNPLPAALDLTAAITRPVRARERTRDRAARTRTGLIAALLLGALGANRAAGSGWFLDSFESGGGLAETLWVLGIAVVVTLVVAGVWRAGEVVVERARGESGTRPLAAALGPVAGTVLLAQAISIGLTQTQNAVVLASDPFAQGWNLFGTVYWQVSLQPLSPFTQGLIQVAVIIAGHLAAIMATSHAATARAADGSTSAAARNRAWNAALVPMGTLVISGVVWTLLLLG